MDKRAFFDIINVKCKEIGSLYTMKKFNCLISALLCLSTTAFAQAENASSGGANDQLIGIGMLLILVLCGAAVGLLTRRLRQWYRSRHYKCDDDE